MLQYFDKSENMNSKYKRSSVQYITVYEYGKKFSPPMFEKRRCKLRNSLQVQEEKGCPDKTDLIASIYHLLRVHRLKRERSRMSQTSCPEKLHNALKRAIRTCYELKIGSSCLYPVGELFYELFLCTSGTTALFSILLDHVWPDKILYPSKSQADLYSAFSYYLQHAQNIYIKGHKQPIDLLNTEIDAHNICPLSAALKKRDPELVLTLVKNGADPLCNSNSSSDEDMCKSPMRLLLDDLSCLFMFKNYAQFSEETKSKLAEQESKAWVCLGYIRRGVSMIPLTSSTHIVTSVHTEDEDDFQDLNETPLELPAYSIHPKLSHTVDIDYFRLPSLKHLSRCAIRSQLKRNWRKVANIPKGISLLPLPRVLKSYLNLEMD